ncbi:MAG TPA: hypothetical protein VI776_13040, partial [Anaerolineales bacterium]|nr:hypothetical protein [Anaerolineales bacterium]
SPLPVMSDLRSVRSSIGYPSAVCLCGPIRQVTWFPRPPPRVLPGAVLYGVRTFLDPDYPGRDHPANLRQFIILAFEADVKCRKMRFLSE